MEIDSQGSATIGPDGYFDNSPALCPEGIPPILSPEARLGKKETSIATVSEYIATRRVLFFDLFHTLTGLESEIPPTCEILGVDRDEWNIQLLECSRDRLVGTSRDPVEFLGKMAHAIDPSIPDELIREAMRLRRIRFASSLINIPAENLATLAELRRRGTRLCLISNADISEAAAWSESPLAYLFNDVLFSCEVGMLKPEPDIYKLGLERMSARTEDAAFIGDGGSGELAGARRVGLSTIMVAGVARQQWPDRIEARRREADYVIERIPDLIDGAAAKSAPELLNGNDVEGIQTHILGPVSVAVSGNKPDTYFPKIRHAFQLWLLLLGVNISIGILLLFILGLHNLSNLSIGSPWYAADFVLGSLSIFIVLIVGWGKNRTVLPQCITGTIKNPIAWAVILVLPLGYVLLIRYLDTWLQMSIPLFKLLANSSCITYGHSKVTTIARFLFPCLIGPVFEELFFRGYLLTGLRERYGRGRAILLTTLLFVASHFDLNNMMAALIMGFPLGIIYAKTGNIIFSIALHALGNLYTRIYPNTGAGKLVLDSIELTHVLIAATCLILGCILLVLLPWNKANRRLSLPG